MVLLLLFLTRAFRMTQALMSETLLCRCAIALTAFTGCRSA
jgi:hypothetical protein